MCYSIVEYAAPVWARSSYVDILDPEQLYRYMYYGITLRDQKNKTNIHNMYTDDENPNLHLLVIMCKLYNVFTRPRDEYMVIS